MNKSPSSKEKDWMKEIMELVDKYRSLHRSVLKAELLYFVERLLQQQKEELVQKIEQKGYLSRLGGIVIIKEDWMKIKDSLEGKRVMLKEDLRKILEEYYMYPKDRLKAVDQLLQVIHSRIKERMDKQQQKHCKKCKECINNTWNIYADAFGDIEDILDEELVKDIDVPKKN